MQFEVLQNAILNYFAGHPNVLLILLPHYSVQEKTLINFCKKHDISYWIPEQVLDGPNLLWKMDLVLSGGGTMTREAAILGVPSYSFFTGQWGAIDRHLKTQGRIVQLINVEDLNKIVLRHRERRPVSVSSDALKFVTDFIEDIVTR